MWAAVKTVLRNVSELTFRKTDYLVGFKIEKVEKSREYKTQSISKEGNI